MKIIRRILITLLIGGGLALSLVPTVWPLVSRQKTADQIRTIHEKSEALDVSERDAQIASALEWNEKLAENTQGLSSIDERDQGYQSQLRFFEDGVMGLIRIPCIDVALPIYHGCSDEVLQMGAGHLPSSSLPIGSATGRTVIAAHGGTVHAALFSRLDELKQGDTFEIVNPQGTLYYQVESTQVIEPGDFETLQIEEGRDLVTLMTCTPYGINTHRLLVTGVRMQPTQALVEESQSKPLELSRWPSMRQLIFSLWPFGLALLVVMSLSLIFRHRKKAADQMMSEKTAENTRYSVVQARVDFGEYAPKSASPALSRKEKRQRRKRYRERFE